MVGFEFNSARAACSGQTVLYFNKGNVQLALLVYNRGPAAVESSREQGRDPSNGYERVVMKGYKGPGVVD